LSILSQFGIPVVHHALVTSEEAALDAAKQIGFPVALKVCSPDIPHKSDIGAVRLNIGNSASLLQAYGEILGNAKQHAPNASLEGVLVQEMVTGVELIAGLVHDATFGPLVLLGTGGIFVEMLRDTSLRLAPLSGHDAEAMIQELRGRALLEGHRGTPGVARQAIVDVLLGLSDLALALTTHVSQIDINPLVASQNGVVAADALIVLKGTDQAVQNALFG
jgi:acetyltransferase